MLEIKPIAKQSLSDMVYYKMLNMIIEGKWAQDEMIPSENELREAFSVSRDTVRQAVHRLSALGILKSRQGKGTYVQKIDTSFYLNLLVPAVFLNEDDGISILQFMKAIQIESVRIAGEKATPEELGKLQDYLDNMKSATDYEKYFEYDNGYHYYLTQLTGNELFIKSADIASRMLHVCLRDIVAFHGSERSVRQHEDCLRALMEHDTNRAVEIMVEHYDMLMQRMHGWLAQSSDSKR